MIKYYMDRSKKIYEILIEQTESGGCFYYVQKLLGFHRKPEIADYTLNDTMMDELGMQELTPEKQEVAKMLYGSNK